LLMARLADVAQAKFGQLLDFMPHIGLVVTPLGFGIAALLVRRPYPQSRGPDGSRPRRHALRLSRRLNRLRP
jgi:hypothetical protein